MDNLEENFLAKNEEGSPRVGLARTGNGTKSKIATAQVDREKMEKILAEKEEGQLTVDIYQTPTEIVITAPIAGVDIDDLDISLSGDMISIKGERKMEPKTSDADYLYQECFWGKFSRTIILPCEVQPDKVKASLKKGILTVVLPKAEKNRVKKIKVSSE